MKIHPRSTLALIVVSSLAIAQQHGQGIQSISGYDEAIEDNSFLIEEAYNQEPGVVQHISNATYFPTPQKNLVYTFTQEWPVFSQAHQFSFTIPYEFLNGNTINGPGDILLNYRYQLFESNDWAAVSPRISFILPTGSENKGLGMGAFGVQVNLPVSKRISNDLVGHFNAGFTVLPDAGSPGGGATATLSSFSIGASAIWLATYHLNFMIEALANSGKEFDEMGGTVRTTEYILNPGVRYAIDIGSLQIVPGVSLPVAFSEGDSQTGWFFYLSFEHPF